MVVTTVGAVGGGGGTAAGESLGVPALGAGGVQASVSRASIMKRTVVAGGRFLSASGTSVSESVAVCALGVAVRFGHFLDHKSFREEEEGRAEDGNAVGVNGDNHRSGLLGEPSSLDHVKVPSRTNRDLSCYPLRSNPLGECSWSA